MARKPLTGGVKLFAQSVAEELPQEEVIKKQPPVAVSLTSGKTLTTKEKNANKQSTFDKKRVVTKSVVDLPKAVPQPVVCEEPTKKKTPKKKDGEKEYITIADGLSRLELFDSNIATLKKYVVQSETDMIARRVRNMLVLFNEYSAVILSGATFEDVSQKKSIEERVLESRLLIRKWDNIPDISDMRMGKTPDKKDKK